MQVKKRKTIIKCNYKLRKKVAQHFQCSIKTNRRWVTLFNAQFARDITKHCYKLPFSYYENKPRETEKDRQQ